MRTKAEYWVAITKALEAECFDEDTIMEASVEGYYRKPERDQVLKLFIDVGYNSELAELGTNIVINVWNDTRGSN